MYVDDNDYKDKFKKKKNSLFRLTFNHISLFIIFSDESCIYTHTHTYIRIINLIATYIYIHSIKLNEIKNK